MKTDSGLAVSAPPSGQPLWRRIIRWPSTRLGWWSVGLAAAFATLGIIERTFFAHWVGLGSFYYFIFMMLCGLVAGIVSLIAVTRQHERSWLVWLAILAGLFALLIALLFILAYFAFRNMVW